MNVDNKKFSDVLGMAIDGDSDATVALISRYMPLINKRSMIKDVYDEDLRQYIIMRVIEQIPRFDPDNVK